jgi:acetolactate synthase small subunit
MHAFHIRYHNTQGTLMRILNAASRRALDIPYVHAEASGPEYTATLLLEVNVKQIGQLCRDWHAIVDVTDVSVGAAPESRDDLDAEPWAISHPYTSRGVRDASASAARA